MAQADAAPLPPPPPGAIERATALVTFPGAESLADYVRRFAEDVVVTDGEKTVAANRDEFLAYLRSRPAMHVRPLHISYGNPILVAETVDNFPERRDPNMMQDCCTWARVSSYHLNPNGLVDRVVFLRNGSYWGPPETPNR